MERAELLREKAIAVRRHHADPVVAAGVADIGAITIGMPVHVRHHVAAIAAAARDQTLPIDIALAQHEIGGRFDIGELSLAVVAGDRF